MKTIILSFFVIFFSFPLLAQSGDRDSTTQEKFQTVRFEVKGVCGMCKERIETAARIKGVRLATWDQDTKQLKVIYKTGKVDEVDIHRAVAGVGHTTSQVPADSTAYQQLPACCAYDDGVKDH